MNIGIAGTGRMGTAVTLRLIDSGHQLTVWNRTRDKTQVLASAGARVAPSPRALAEAADILISFLSDVDAVDATYLGAQGLLSANVRGKLFIEMSTVQPATERSLAEQVRAAGAALVECPVGGSTGPARDGKLFGLVGGATDDIARARPILDQLCRRIEHVGEIGAGAAMKLAINLPLLVYWQALAKL